MVFYLKTSSLFSMFSDEKLIEYNKRGLIPGPSETNDQYYQRVHFCEKFFANPQDFLTDFSLEDRLARKDLDWVYAKLIKTYDIAPDFLVAFFSNKNLYFFQGACTWIFKQENHPMGVVQLRKKLKTKKLWLYDREEILTHEMAHLARMAFEEKSEEVFAYLLSSSAFRRTFGAIIEEEREVLGFFALFALAMGSFLFSSILFAFFSSITGAFLSWGLFRLYKKKRYIKKAAKHLLSLVKKPNWVRAILFRLTDKEIYLFSKWREEEILSYVKNEKTLRWKMIRLCYFSSKRFYGNAKNSHSGSQKARSSENVSCTGKRKHSLFS